MESINPEVLIESKSARENALGDTSQLQCQIKLRTLDRKIPFKKIDMEQYMTTKQVANLYQVSESAIREIIKTNKKELESDGLKVLRGKELKDARPNLGLPSKTSQATLFTPRAVLRVGMLLRDSEVAVKLRSTLLDVAEEAPKKLLWFERMGQFQDKNQWKYPEDHFSVFEVAIPFLRELESKGCPIPDNLIPDISIGKRWCTFLREEMGIDPESISVEYVHEYPDGRKAPHCKAYKEEYLVLYKKWFRKEYRSNHLAKYIVDRKDSPLEEKVKALKAISDFPDVNLNLVKMPKLLKQELIQQKLLS